MKLVESDIVVINEYADKYSAWFGHTGIVQSVHFDGLIYVRLGMVLENKYKLFGKHDPTTVLMDIGFKPHQLTKLGTLLPEIRFKRNKIDENLWRISQDKTDIAVWNQYTGYVFECNEMVCIGKTKSKAEIKRRLKKKTKTVEYWTLED